MAILFGKETFEGGSLPASFDSEVNSFGTATLAADATSKINGTYSLSVTSTDEAARYLKKDLGAGYSELWFQFYIHLPTGWTFPTGGFLMLAMLNDASDNPICEIKLEDASANRLIIQGSDLPYLDTAINIALNTPTKVEVYVKKSATVGQVKVWINNNTEGSPDYDSGAAQNTGATQMRIVDAGIGYTPAALTKFYLDDIIVANAFIGAGSTIEQEGYRFRADDGSESVATFLASQDTAITRIKSTNTRVRVIMNATGDRASEQYQLEYRKAGSGDEWHPIIS